jgi:DNA polymerase-1
MAERQAVNSIIQGSATDITKWAQIQIHKFQSDYDAKMLAQVHDEIAWEVHKDAVEDFGRKASEVMVTAGEHFNIRVPMEASPQWGLNWAEAK